MRRKYRAWIKKHVDGDGAGLCGEYALLMHARYPELDVIYGDYVLGKDSEDHYWCWDKQMKEIVDPTAQQFIPGGGYRRRGRLLARIGERRFRCLIPIVEFIEGARLLPHNTEVAWELLAAVIRVADRRKPGVG